MRTEPLTFSSKTTDFTTQFDNPIQLNKEKSYEAAFFLLETFNTIPNVTNENNNFTYSADNGTTWKSIKLKKEAYEIEQINNEIQRQMIESRDYNVENDSMHINISIFASLLSAIEINNPSYKINFDVKNSIGPLLGFDKQLLSFGYHISPNILNITPITSIFINCDIIQGTYVNGRRAKVIHSFSPNVGPGYKIREKPQPELVFCSINLTEINSIRIWLTDEENNPIDLQGQEITIRILIREEPNNKDDIKDALQELKFEKFFEKFF